MRQITEFPNYSIDEYGNVYSNRKLTKVNTFIDRSHGLRKVNLFKNGKQFIRLIHRLVAIAYIEKKEGSIVIHKDGDKLNNHFTNLEWRKKEIKIKK